METNRTRNVGMKEGENNVCCERESECIEIVTACGKYEWRDIG